MSQISERAQELVAELLKDAAGPNTLLQDDPHQWSERPCPTCRAIGSVVGKPFGCYVYAQQWAVRRAAQPPAGRGKS